MLKAYLCDDYDIYAAENAEQAAQLYREHAGEGTENGYPWELTDAQLDVEYPAFDENEEPRAGETTSIRQMLAECGDHPGWLAGCE